MLDLKAGLLVVPTEAELELEVTPLHALQRFYKHHIEHSPPKFTKMHKKYVCASVNTTEDNSANGKHMKPPLPPPRSWASYKPSSSSANIKVKVGMFLVLIIYQRYL